MLKDIISKIMICENQRRPKLQASVPACGEELPIGLGKRGKRVNWVDGLSYFLFVRLVNGTQLFDVRIIYL